MKGLFRPNPQQTPHQGGSGPTVVFVRRVPSGHGVIGLAVAFADVCEFSKCIELIGSAGAP
jgi:hypothetical protein